MVPAAASAPDPAMNNGFILGTFLKFPTAEHLEYSIPPAQMAS
jgi:hypothetical protein